MTPGRIPDDAAARLGRRVARLEDELARSEAARRQLIQSTSWRLTAPLRWAKELVTGTGSRAATALSSKAGTSEVPRIITDLPVELRAPVALDSLYGSNKVFRPLELREALDKVVPCLGSASGAALAGREKEDLFLGEEGTAQASIGLIGSRELAHELAFDARVRQLRAESWREQLDAAPLDFVLVGTAWEPDGGWRHGLRGLGREAQELSGLLAHASNAGLPVALWVRDAPDAAAHYAWLLPHVQAAFAVDDETARRLASNDSNRPVKVLAPAFQPRLHHPVRSDGLRQAAPLFTDRVLFDGWWDLAGDAGADPVLRELATDRLVVVDSEWEVGGVRIPDLPLYQPGMAGCMSALEKSALSKLVPLEYQAGSSLAAPWQRAQGALRAAACGAVVIGAPSASAWPDVPSIPGPGEDPLVAINGLLADPLERMRIAHRGFRAIMSRHRYSDRIGAIMRDLGLIPRVEEAPQVAVVLVTMRPERLADALAYYRAQDYPNRQLVVVLHGTGALSAIRRELREGEQVYRLGTERSLGDCLNFAIEQTDAPYWAKIDDDDHYGPSYLSDLLLYRHTAPAQVWRKPPMFLHSQAHDELC